MTSLLPLVSFEPITLDELNACLAAWGHKMGELRRPPEYGFWGYGLRHEGRLVAVTATSSLIRETCAGEEWLPRETAVELSRVCAAREHLNRVALRLWREFAFPAICAARGFRWAVSYQDAALHTGDLYRFDGWVPLVRFKSGAGDPRSGRFGRRGVVWGWHADPAIRAARATAFRESLKGRAAA